jgi:hypothetical protein
MYDCISLKFDPLTLGRHTCLSLDEIANELVCTGPHIPCYLRLEGRSTSSTLHILHLVRMNYLHSAWTESSLYFQHAT